MTRPAGAAAARLPRRPGVYRFRDASRRVLYLGRATDLRSRVPSYWGHLDERPWLQHMVARIASVEAVVCASVHEASWLERNLLEASLPRWNRTPGGQETVVYLAVDDRAGSPGVRVVHEVDEAEAGSVFGPYLGGLRAQLAVTGLNRALPLAYTGARMTASERELAATKGVAPSARVELAELVVRVLGRDQDAIGLVRGRLRNDQERASDALAFELAARIRDEIAAVEWVTAAQRVTQIGDESVEVCGWADGLLVQFSVRNGRLDRWRQRPASARSAQPYLNATPAHWRAFADENAKLAAYLA